MSAKMSYVTGISQNFGPNCVEISGRRLAHENIIFEQIKEDMTLISG